MNPRLALPPQLVSTIGHSVNQVQNFMTVLWLCLCLGLCVCVCVFAAAGGSRW